MPTSLGLDGIGVNAMAFDPYESWLGIPADRRPPSHYDLLGLAPFEPDAEKVEQAALRRMGAVRQHQIGPHAEVSQQVLSELARARLILMDSDRRSAYDAKLRARGARPPDPPADAEAIGDDIAGPLVKDREDALNLFTALAVAESAVGRPVRPRAEARDSHLSGRKLVALGLFMASHGALIWAFVVFLLPRLLTRMTPHPVPPPSVRPPIAPRPSPPVDLVEKRAPTAPRKPPLPGEGRTFDGRTRITIAGGDAFEMTDRDYTIVARIRTRDGGTIFSKTARENRWVPDGKSFFVRDGKLGFDIGWVACVESTRRVDDGAWHDVAMTFVHDPGAVCLFIDGTLERIRPLAPRSNPSDHVVRIGYTGRGMPSERSYFVGEISEVNFYGRALKRKEIHDLHANGSGGAPAAARWVLRPTPGATTADETGHGHDGRVEVEAPRPLLAMQPPPPPPGDPAPAPKPEVKAFPPLPPPPPNTKAAEPAVVVRARENLDRAKQLYYPTRERARAFLLRKFDESIWIVNNNPDGLDPAAQVALLATLDSEKTRFKDHSTLPRSPWMIGALIAYQQALHGPRVALTMAYHELLLLLQKTDIQAAGDLAREIQRFEREAGEMNLFVVGSFWEGKRVHHDHREVGFSLRVLTSRGNSFTGEVNFHGAVARVEGLFNGFDVGWRTVRMVDGRDFKDWEIKGIVYGDTLMGEFAGANRILDQVNPVQGVFQLTLKR